MGEHKAAKKFISWRIVVHSRGFQQCQKQFRKARQLPQKRGENSIREFNVWIEDLELEDAPWMERKFT